jgi:hypothetical protein
MATPVSDPTWNTPGWTVQLTQRSIAGATTVPAEVLISSGTDAVPVTTRMKYGINGA